VDLLEQRFQFTKSRDETPAIGRFKAMAVQIADDGRPRLGVFPQPGDRVEEIGQRLVVAEFLTGFGFQLFDGGPGRVLFAEPGERAAPRRSDGVRLEIIRRRQDPPQAPPARS
jgi:hypothetical protein